MRAPTPLRDPSFRALWSAGLVSDTGDWLLLIALPVVVFQLTGSAVGTATAFLVELVPAVVFAPVIGRLVDRVDRRRLMLLVTPLQGVALLPLLLVHHRADLPLLYAVIAVEAALMALFEPAKNAMLPSLVGDGELVGANSLIGLNQNLGRLVGGPLGGVILAAGGLEAVVLADALSYAGAFVLLLRVRSRREVTGRAAAPSHHTVGWSVLRRRPIPVLLAVTVVAQAAQGLFVALFILFVVQRLGGGAAEIGLLRGVQAIGGLLGGLLVAALARRVPAVTLVAGGALLFGVIDAMIWNGPALTTATGVYAVLFVLVGLPGVAYATGLLSLLQTAAPHHLGRVFGAYGVVANVGQGVGLVAAGLLTAPIGLLTVLNVQAALYVLAGLLAAVLLRDGMVRWSHD